MPSRLRRAWMHEQLPPRQRKGDPFFASQPFPHQHLLGIMFKHGAEFDLARARDVLATVQEEFPKTAINIAQGALLDPRRYWYRVGEIPIDVRQVPSDEPESIFLSRETERLLDPTNNIGYSKVDPLVRVTVLQTHDHTLGMIFLFSHHFFDGRSSQIIAQTFMDLYCYGERRMWPAGADETQHGRMKLALMTPYETRRAAGTIGLGTPPARSESFVRTGMEGFPENVETDEMIPRTMAPSTPGNGTNGSCKASRQMGILSTVICFDCMQTTHICGQAKQEGVTVNSYLTAAYSLALAECCRSVAGVKSASSGEDLFAACRVAYDVRARFHIPPFAHQPPGHAPRAPTPRCLSHRCHLLAVCRLGESSRPNSRWRSADLLGRLSWAIRN